MSKRVVFTICYKIINFEMKYTVFCEQNYGNLASRLHK